MTIVLSYLLYYALATIGITFGYHRYVSHKNFKVNSVGEVFILSCGLLCGGRSPLSWAGIHRMHHLYSDTEKDPHGTGLNALLSIWKVKDIPRKFVKDLYKNPRVVWFHKYHKVLWLSSAIVCLPIIEYWVLIQLYSWAGFGILNYFGHVDRKPVNRAWINIIAPFEGNHADHHAIKPASLGRA